MVSQYLVHEFHRLDILLPQVVDAVGDDARIQLFLERAGEELAVVYAAYFQELLSFILSAESVDSHEAFPTFVKILAATERVATFQYDFIILEECSVEELDKKEKYYIAKIHPSYNISTGGRGNYGFKPTEEQKEKSRQGALKQWREMDEETKQKIIKNNLTWPHKGYKMSEETKKKISEKNKGKKWTPELREKIAEAKRKKKESGYRQTNEGHKKTVICTTTSQTFESVKAAGEYFGISPSSITGVLKGRQKATHNLTFIYGERNKNNGK